MENKTLPQMGSMQELTNVVTRQLAAGKTQDEVIQQLVQRGWPMVSARQFVANLGSPSGAVQNTVRQRRTLTLHGKWRLLRGILLIVTGMVTVGAGLAVSDLSTSLFIFAVGVILFVFGLLDFLFGLSTYLERDDI
jgi:small-conductance mechanosensitive channel